MEEGLEDVGMEFLDTAAVDDDDSGNAGEEMADEEDPELSRIVQASLEGQQEEAPAAGAPMSQYIQVSPDEKGAIDRLVGLGFERARVIEAFFACDKNETLAANFLFDNMNEE